MVGWLLGCDWGWSASHVLDMSRKAWPTFSRACFPSSSIHWEFLHLRNLPPLDLTEATIESITLVFPVRVGVDRYRWSAMDTVTRKRRFPTLLRANADRPHRTSYGPTSSGRWEASAAFDPS